VVAHEIQGFILVRGIVYANPYCSGAAALVFVCSITKVVAPSYEVDGIGERLDPEPEVSTLLYIGRRGRITERTIGLTDCVFGLLQQIDPSYRLDMSASVCLDLHVGRPHQPLRASPPRLLDR
jgi:hypothetical protein